MRRQINSIIISVIVGLIWNVVWLEFAKGKNDYEFPCSFFLIFYPSISLIFARSLTNFNFVRLLTNFWDNYPIMILLPNFIFNIWLFYIILQLRVLLKIDSFNLAQIWIRFTRNHTRVIDNDIYSKNTNWLISG